MDRLAESNRPTKVDRSRQFLWNHGSSGKAKSKVDWEIVCLPKDEGGLEFNMSRTNSQAEIVSEEQLVPRANRLVIKKNNQRVASDSHITDTMLRFKVESEKAKIVDEPKEQHVSPVKSGRGKGFMCYGDQVANVPNKLMKDVVPRKTRSLTIAEETVVVTNTYAEWGQKLKGPAVDDPAVQSLLDLQKGSKVSRLESLKQKKQAVVGEGSSATHNKYYDSSDNDSDATLYSLSLDKTGECANETDDADESDMDLPDDNPHGDDDAARYGVFMHNKSTATPNSTYLSPMVTSSSLDFIQNLLDETPANELMDFMSHPVYTDAHTTSVVHNP
ncbi:hypothetical protein Tco_1142259 [Tanacetum coccineum]